MLSKNVKLKSMTSMMPNMVNPLEDREMFQDWRLNIHFPPVNVSKGEEWFKVNLAAPGFKKENFKVEVKDNVLIISAEKKEKIKEVNEEYTHQEFNYHTFKRTFSLPENVNSKELDVIYKRGILTVRLPKTS